MTDERDNTCEWMSAYLDGELKGAEAERAESRLRSDPALTAELAKLRKTRELVHRLPREQAPDDFVSRVLARAERANLVGQAVPAARRAPLQWVQWAAMAAVLLIAVGVGITVYMSLNTRNYLEEMAAKGKAPQAATSPSAPGEPSGPVLIASKDGARESADGLDVTAAPVITKAMGKGGIDTKTGAGDAYRDKTTGGGSAGESIAADLRDVAVAAANLEIYTDNVPEVRRAVEVALGRNGIETVQAQSTATNGVQSRLPVQGNIAAVLPQAQNPNLFNNTTLAPGRVQYIVWVATEQKSKVERDVKAVAARQRVSQASGNELVNGSNRDLVSALQQRQTTNQFVQASPPLSEGVAAKVGREAEKAEVAKGMDRRESAPPAAAADAPSQAVRPNGRDDAGQMAAGTAPSAEKADQAKTNAAKGSPAETAAPTGEPGQSQMARRPGDETGNKPQQQERQGFSRPTTQPAAPAVQQDQALALRRQLRGQTELNRDEFIAAQAQAGLEPLVITISFRSPDEALPQTEFMNSIMNFSRDAAFSERRMAVPSSNEARPSK